MASQGLGNDGASVHEGFPTCGKGCCNVREAFLHVGRPWRKRARSFPHVGGTLAQACARLSTRWGDLAASVREAFLTLGRPCRKRARSFPNAGERMWQLFPQQIPILEPPFLNRFPFWNPPFLNRFPFWNPRQIPKIARVLLAKHPFRLTINNNIYSAPCC